jgi:hypothetical protein
MPHRTCPSVAEKIQRRLRNQELLEYIGSQLLARCEWIKQHLGASSLRNI